MKGIKMADILFYISLTLIWTMLLYHMFLMQGGYMHYRSFEKPIRQWERNMKDMKLGNTKEN